MTGLYNLSKAKILALTDFDEILTIESYDHFQETATEPPTEEETTVDVEKRFEQWAYDTVQAKLYSETEGGMFTGRIGYDSPDLVYNQPSDGKSDWTLIHVYSFPSPDWTVEMRLSGRIISGADDPIFRFDYGVYDAAQDTFYDLYAIRDRAGDYPGSEKALDDLKIGRPLGDADSDGELSVLDATRIQRILAELIPAWDNGGSYLLVEEVSIYQNNERSFADYDCDGDINILDATAIQRALVGLTPET